MQFCRQRTSAEDSVRCLKPVLVQDDMELAPDFFSYFESTSRLLTSDPSLYCISSWNDHGQKHFVRDEARLYRSDFFPGLGWMLTADLWREIRQASQLLRLVMHRFLEPEDRQSCARQL